MFSKHWQYLQFRIRSFGISRTILIVTLFNVANMLIFYAVHKYIGKNLAMVAIIVSLVFVITGVEMYKHYKKRGL